MSFKLAPPPGNKTPFIEANFWKIEEKLTMIPWKIPRMILSQRMGTTRMMLGRKPVTTSNHFSTKWLSLSLINAPCKNLCTQDPSSKTGGGWDLSESLLGLVPDQRNSPSAPHLHELYIWGSDVGRIVIRRQWSACELVLFSISRLRENPNQRSAVEKRLREDFLALRR